jgi:hypothetical protein
VQGKALLCQRRGKSRQWLLQEKNFEFLISMTGSRDTMSNEEKYDWKHKGAVATTRKEFAHVSVYIKAFKGLRVK